MTVKLDVFEVALRDQMDLAVLHAELLSAAALVGLKQPPEEDVVGDDGDRRSPLVFLLLHPPNQPQKFLTPPIELFHALELWEHVRVRAVRVFELNVRELFSCLGLCQGAPVCT